MPALLWGRQPSRGFPLVTRQLKWRMTSTLEARRCHSPGAPVSCVLNRAAAPPGSAQIKLQIRRLAGRWGACTSGSTRPKSAPGAGGSGSNRHARTIKAWPVRAGRFVVKKPSTTARQPRRACGGYRSSAELGATTFTQFAVSRSLPALTARAPRRALRLSTRPPPNQRTWSCWCRGGAWLVIAPSVAP